jgi:hypothetical protein
LAFLDYSEVSPAAFEKKQIACRQAANDPFKPNSVAPGQPDTARK